MLLREPKTLPSREPVLDLEVEEEEEEESTSVPVSRLVRLAPLVKGSWGVNDFFALSVWTLTTLDGRKHTRRQSSNREMSLILQL